MLNCTISMAEHYPHFEERVRDALRVVLGHDVEARIKIGMAKDGSGVGGELFLSHSFCDIPFS